MGNKKTSFLCTCFVIILTFVLSSPCEGYKFYVGGRDGWVTHPSEDYHHWAQRMRFQVNDTLFFKYQKGNDSVLMVTKENYNTCNTKNPIKSLSDDYKFERSGPHYFISGNANHCEKGQKLIIVVLAIRHKKSPPKPTPAPSPAPVPSQASVPTPATATAPAPVAAADSPAPAQEKSAATMIGYSVGGLVVCVVIGSGLILGI